MNRLRSLRATLVGAGLILVALPLVLLLVAWLYERSIVSRYAQALAEVAADARGELAGGGPRALPAAARRHGVGMRLLAADGSEIAAEIDGGEADPSMVGRVGERLLEPLGRARQSESLRTADASLGPPATRPEIDRARRGEIVVEFRESASGETLLFTRSERLGDGTILQVIEGSHRGIRRLISLRWQLVQLTLYQTVLVLLAMLLLGRHVAFPLEALAEAARRYPAAPLAEKPLLVRRDEIGDVARAMTAMAMDLEARWRATADLGADVAHEFKNPLATISASAELLETTRHPTPEQVRLVADAVTSAVNRLRRSIDDMLALVRLEVALPDEERTSIGVAELLESVAAEYRRDPRFSGDGAWRVTVEVAADAGSVMGVHPRLVEVLRNLVDNALAQPAERREIVFAARRLDAEVVLSVRDFGPGVSAGNRDKIFRRFFTQRPAGAPPGTGLGLSVVESVARAHGGRVELQPDCGPGAEVRVVIPGLG